MKGWALGYVGRGLQVIPLHTPTWIGGEWRCSCGQWPDPNKPGKHPRAGYGLRHAVSTADEVEEAWGRWPDANIGIVVPRGFVVADLDGPRAIEWWEQRVGQDQTRMALSGSGRGQHRWYRANGVQTGVLQREGEHDEGWEVKVIASERGYVVAPPSLWCPSMGGGPSAARRYEWGREGPALTLTAELGGHRNGNGQLPPAEGGETSSNRLTEAAGKVRGEGRDSLMLRHLGAVYAAGVGERALGAAAEELNDLFQDPLEPEVVARHVRFILGKPSTLKVLASAQAAALSNTDGEDPRPVRLQVEQTDPKTWLIWFPGDRVVRVKTPDLSGPVWGRIVTAHMEQHETQPLWTPTAADAWSGGNGLRTRLLDAMTEEDHLPAPAELTIAGRVLHLLQRYAGDPPIDPSDPQAQPAILEESGGVWWDLGGGSTSGRVVFRFAGLLAFYSRIAPAGERLSSLEIRRGVLELGGMVSARVELAGGREARRQARLSWVPQDQIT